MKKVFISTLGCAKNMVDSEMMLGSLLHNGYENTNKISDADIAIINTCGFIEAAKEESINEILQFAKHKTNGDLKKLIVTGCLAQRYSKELEQEIPEIDLILGTTSFINIVSQLEKETPAAKSVIESIDKEIPSLERFLLTESHTAYLKIAEGCDNFCTYCIIPKLRGKYRSRDLQEILEEARGLVKNGVRELIVIAQDTTKYGIDNYGRKMLPELLRELDKIEELVWVRVLYSYPEDIDEEMVLAIKSSEKILPYFDMPIQHASDVVLKKMNRKTSAAQIKDKVQMIRRHIPDATIRTTIIVGFPQESEKDFEFLCRFVEEMQFDRLGVFEYSEEEGTPAAKMSGQIDPETKSQRKDRLMALQQEISYRKNKDFIGKTLKALLEDQEEGVYVGRTSRDMIEIDGIVFVNTNKNCSRGEFVDVRITDALEYDLIGEIDEHTE